MIEWYFNPIGNYALVAILALLLFLALGLIGIPSGRLAGRRRGILFGIRLAVVVMAILAMLRPSLVHSQTKRQTATLVVLLDSSRSMQVPDSFGGKTRWESLKSTVADALPALSQVARDLEVKIYSFDRDLRPLDFSRGKLDLSAPPAGKQTALGAVLEDVLQRESGKRLAAVLLLSDGAQRAYAPRDASPQTAARRLADLGYPLYTMTFGEARGAGQARDVAIKDLLVNQTVFVKNELAVAGAARVDGYSGHDIPVQLLFESPEGKMVPVKSTSIRSAQEGEAIPIELAFAPEIPGDYKVTLKADEQAGELVTTNNELSTFVAVLKGGLKVLYLEGAPRSTGIVEQKFLRWSLDASPDIKVDYLSISERSPSEREGDLLRRFLRSDPEMHYDVYVLGDLDSAAFTETELTALAQVVRNGAGLIMLGGFHTFGPGGYSRTPLASVMPVEMEDLERQRFDDAIRSDVHLPGPLKMRPARPLGTRHYVMSLAPAAENDGLWQQLPPLDGANRLGKPKPAAQVLAESSDGHPLLVANEAGGRVMAMAVDSTWRWWMQGHEPEHKRFWRQVILWLARKDELAEGNVWVRLDQRRFSPGGPVHFTVGARSPQGDIVRGAKFQAEITLPQGGKQIVPLADQGTEAAGSFTDTQLAGDYTLSVAATLNGADLGTAKARFLVFEQDLELDTAAADPTLMDSLAKITELSGGKSLAPEELPDLIEQIKRKPPDLDVQTQVRETPWDTWPFFLMFAGLLCGEWYLRKKWGLV